MAFVSKDSLVSKGSNYSVAITFYENIQLHVFIFDQN